MPRVRRRRPWRSPCASRFVEKQVNKLNKRKEFFQVSLKELKKVVGELGIESTWTMECEASEYRETVALEM